MPVPTWTPPGGVATDPAGAVWQPVDISRLYTPSIVRAGAGVQIVAEAPVNLCCYPGNTVRFTVLGELDVGVEMGGWVPTGRVCSPCVSPATLTGAATFNLDRPGRWVFRDVRTGARMELDVP